MVLQKSFPSVKKRTVTRPPGGELGGAMFKAYQPALAPPHPYSVLPTNPIKELKRQRIKTTQKTKIRSIRMSKKRFQVGD